MRSDPRKGPSPIIRGRHNAERNAFSISTISLLNWRVESKNRRLRVLNLQNANPLKYPRLFNKIPALSPSRTKPSRPSFPHPFLLTCRAFSLPLSQQALSRFVDRKATNTHAHDSDDSSSVGCNSLISLLPFPSIQL
jgi:hypothetical protein